jgi:DNA-binding NarL/FixJ family response regulator
MIRISIYEDNSRLAELVTIMIENTEGFEVVGLHGNCSTILSDYAQEQPQVVLMDIDMPLSNGLEGVTKLKHAHPQVKVLMHTVFDDDNRLFDCLRRGADGYILKRDSSTILMQAIRNVLAGDAPMSPGIARQVLQAFRQQQNNYQLTSRETEILQALAQGNSYKLIAAQYQISAETVRRHLQNIYHKLQVQSATEAVSKALREKLVD